MKKPDEEIVTCPQCGAALERRSSGVWFCEKCPRDWTPGELAQNPDDVRDFTAPDKNVSQWNCRVSAFVELSEAVKSVVKIHDFFDFVNLKPRRRREALTRFEVMGKLKGAPKPL